MLQIYFRVLLTSIIFIICPRAGLAEIVKPSIATTTSILRDLITQIAGDTVTVEALMGAGVDPHLYKVTPGDIRKLTSADLIVYHGLHLEGRMSEALESLGKRKITIPAAEALPKSSLRMNDGIPDPHVWFDVSLWQQVAQSLAINLGDKLPNLKQTFIENGNRYCEELKKLDVEVASAIASIPEPQRNLVTAHDAFSYFGNRYNITVHGIQGVSTDSEAGLKHIQSLIDLLVSLKIKAVFLETSVGERSIQALIDGSKSHGHQVSLAGPLYSDALGPAGSEAETYVGMVRANVRTITRALGGIYGH